MQRDTSFRLQDLIQPVSNPPLFHTLAFRRKTRRLAAQLAQYVRFYADCYSAALQFEDLANLSTAELERRGIARGDLHRQVADALPKWPGGRSPDETNRDRHPQDANTSSGDFKTWSAGRAAKISQTESGTLHSV